MPLRKIIGLSCAMLMTLGGSLSLARSVLVNTAVPCNSDSDCTQDSYCAIDPVTQDQACAPRLPPLTRVPPDHGSCGASCTVSQGVCTSSGDATRACASGTCDFARNVCSLANGAACDSNAIQCNNGYCDPTTHLCGFANGAGPCEVGDPFAVCQSLFCGPNNLCAPCGADADCAGSAMYCASDTHACTKPQPLGQPTPSDPVHVQCADGNNLGCETGHCNVVTGACALAANQPCTSPGQCAGDVCDADRGLCGAQENVGECSDANAALVCQSGLCNATTGKCGLPNGANCGAVLPLMLDGNAADANCAINICDINTSRCGFGPADGNCTTLLSPQCESGLCNLTTSHCGGEGGSACSTDGECAGNHCADGMCGDAPGLGICDDANARAACQSKLCNSETGTCGLPNGQSCSDNNQCANNTCSAGACGLAVGSGPCTADNAAQLCITGLCNPLTHTCGYANGAFYDKQCTDNSQCFENNCQSGLHLCGFYRGTGPCNDTNAYAVCGHFFEPLACSPLGLCAAQPGLTCCGSNSECLNNICDGSSGTCGWGVNSGPCTQENALAVCAFGVCSPTGMCTAVAPALNVEGSCAVDDDCSGLGGQSFCWFGQNEASCEFFASRMSSNVSYTGFYCTPALENGVPLPNDGRPFTDSTYRDGTCSPQNANAACLSHACNSVSKTCAGLVGAACTGNSGCASNVCGDNGVCGIPTGQGPCTASTSDAACQIGACGSNGLCGAVNSAACAQDSDCQSAICAADHACGYPDGQGPCSQDNASALCRSGFCGNTNICLSPTSGCTADAQCASGMFCFADACLPKLVSGVAIPADAQHGGTCTAAHASAVCLSNACNAQTNTCAGANGVACTEAKQCSVNACGDNGLCGLDNGEGPCSIATAGVCQSNTCGMQGQCVAMGGCTQDVDCPPHMWCSPGMQLCKPKLPIGAPVSRNLSDTALCTPEDAKAMCATGYCNSVTGQCAAGNGETCTYAGSCAANVCADDGKCGLASATACSVSSECRSGKCATGYCATVGAVASGHGLFSCAATHGPLNPRRDGEAALGVGAAMASFWLLRRRRRLAALGLAAAALFSGGQASAAAEPGFGVDVINAAEPGSRWITAESLLSAPAAIDPNYASGPQSLVLRLDGVDAQDPLVVRLGGSDVLTHIVSNQAALTLGGGYSPIRQLRVNISIPFQLSGKGDMGTDNDYLLLPPSHSSALGDVRLGATYIFDTSAGDALRFGLTARLRTPTGSQNAYAGDGTPSGMLLATGAGDVGHFAYSLSLGARGRSTSHFASVDLGTQLLAVAAVGWQNSAHSLLVGLEVPMATVVTSDQRFKSAVSSVDPMVGGHWWVIPNVGLHLAASTGFTTGLGEPQWRINAAVEWWPLPPPAPALAEVLPPPALEAPPPATAPEPAPEASNPASLPVEPMPAAPLDTDHDGVPDAEDGCPDGKPGDPNRRGCAEADSDGDGVPDSVDNCPKEFGIAANHGCATPQHAKIEAGKLILDGALSFQTGKDVLGKDSYVLLDNVAAVLVSHPNIVALSIEGHTDNSGNAAKNRDLSKRRAQSVQTYLVQHGVAAARLKATGFGSDRPLAANDSPEGRSTNQRVEFIIGDTAPASSAEAQ